jgi:hypothetical protein
MASHRNPPSLTARPVALDRYIAQIIRDQIRNQPLRLAIRPLQFSESFVTFPESIVTDAIIRVEETI